MSIIGAFRVSLFLTAGSLMSTCTGGGPTRDGEFGPPSGFARVEGRVLRADGTAGPVGMRVALTRCGDPIGGFAGEATTTHGGEYSVVGALPPIGMRDGSDSVAVDCEIVAGGGFAESDEFAVYFFRPPREPTVLRVDVRAAGAP
jgi:hypothetical protein